MKKALLLLLFAFVWFLVFFLSEFLLSYFFEDQTPLWKILAISTISAVGICWPFLKNSNEFEPLDLLKMQRVEIKLNKALEANDFEKLITALKAKGFRIKKNQTANRIAFRSRISKSSWGEIYRIDLNDNTAVISSKPLFKIDIYDGGRAKKNIAVIKEVITRTVTLY
jgi:hypothetical protein